MTLALNDFTSNGGTLRWPLIDQRAYQSFIIPKTFLNEQYFLLKDNRVLNAK